MPRKLKFQLGDRVRANEKAPGDYVEREGTVTDRGPMGDYGVRFDDGHPTKAGHGYLNSGWLDRVS